ncbi:hypothetical protein GmHk_20G057571 [Glycine max]|nr:hypothetical protein GmHk_20G057571 [Glycine max]
MFDSNEDELAFISHKIRKIWTNKGGSKWRNSLRRMPRDKKDKDKSFIVFYERKKLRHFKMKDLMNMWEDLDDTSSDEDNEEANICLMEDIASEGSESNQEDEVNFDDPESLRKT